MRSISLVKGGLVLLATVGLAIQPQPLFPQAKNPKGLTPEQVAAIHGRIVEVEEANAIPNRLAKETGDIYIYAPGQIVNEVQFLDPKDEVARWLLRCDLVAVGKMGTGASYMTARKGFLNTDWSYEVAEVIKNNPKAPVASGSTITVVATEGKLKIGNRTVHAVQRTFREFRTGEQYLLFLKFVPETGAYSGCGPRGFTFSGIRAVRLRTQSLRPDIEQMDRDALIELIREVLKRH